MILRLFTFPQCISFLVILMGCLGSLLSPAEVHHWAIELYLDVPLSQQGELQLLAGVSPAATDGYDIEFDLPYNPPPPPPRSSTSELLLFYFPHPEFIAQASSERFISDIRAPFVESKQWQFVLETNLVNSDMFLSWNLEVLDAQVPAEYRVLLEDRQAGELISMVTEAQYVLQTGTAPMKREFTLSVINDPPAAVQGFRAQLAPDGIHLYWTASSEPDVSTYLIRYGTQSATYDHELRVEGVSDVLLGEVRSRQTYYFQILAIDRTGLDGPPSAKVRCSLIADLDDNRRVDYRDLFLAASQWMRPEANVDLTGDGLFEFADLYELVGPWRDR